MLNNGNEVEQNPGVSLSENKIPPNIVSRQTTLYFQVPKKGMPILPARKNEVSSSVTQLVSALSPLKFMNSLDRNAKRVRKRKQEQDQIKRKSRQYSAVAFQQGLDRKRRRSRIGRDMERARRSAEGWGIMPTEWAKNSVIMQMIRSALTQSASMRGGVIIQFRVNEETAQYARQDPQIVPNNNQFIHYVISNPFDALYKVFFYFEKRWRGWEDSVQILMWILINPLTVSLELVTKIIGAVLTQPSRRVWLGIFNDKGDMLKCAGYSFFGVFTLPIWALGQAFFIFGNTLGYGRRTIDAFLNMLTIVMAFFSGNRAKYPYFLDCIGLFSVNMLQLFVSYIGLTSLFLLIPNEITYPLAIFSLPLTQTFLEVIPTTIKKLYLKIAEPLEMSKGAHFLGHLISWMTVSPLLQMAQGFIETFMIKLRNNTIKNSFINCFNWMKDKLSSDMTSMPDLEIEDKETRLPVGSKNATNLIYNSNGTIQMANFPVNVGTTAAMQTLMATSNSSMSLTSNISTPLTNLPASPAPAFCDQNRQATSSVSADTLSISQKTETNIRLKM